MQQKVLEINTRTQLFGGHHIIYYTYITYNCHKDKDKLRMRNISNFPKTAQIMSDRTRIPHRNTIHSSEFYLFIYSFISLSGTRYLGAVRLFYSVISLVPFIPHLIQTRY